MNEHARAALIGTKLSLTQNPQQPSVPPLCVCQQCRSPILHSRVDRSSVCFIHSTCSHASRDSPLPCASVGIAHSEQCIDSARDWPLLGGGGGQGTALDCCCVYFELKYHYFVVFRSSPVSVLQISPEGPAPSFFLCISFCASC